jgi:hypothetical protein
MFWRKPKRKTEVHTKRTVSFVGEQDGEPERVLKSSLVNDFRNVAELERAYLARVEYADGMHVALCLAAREDPQLVERIGVRFSEIFGRHEHLDILFLGPGQEAELQRVCAPFHVAVAAQ